MKWLKSSRELMISVDRYAERDASWVCVVLIGCGVNHMNRSVILMLGSIFKINWCSIPLSKVDTSESSRLMQKSENWNFSLQWDSSCFVMICIKNALITLNDSDQIKHDRVSQKIMAGAEAEPVHFIIPSTEFISFSCWYSGRYPSRARLIATYKNFRFSLTNLWSFGFIVTSRT